MSVSSGPSLQDDFSNIPLADDDPQGKKSISMYRYVQAKLNFFSRRLENKKIFIHILINFSCDWGWWHNCWIVHGIRRHGSRQEHGLNSVHFYQWEQLAWPQP